MDVATINSRKTRLKKAINKSLQRLRVGQNGKLSSLEKQKIKRTVGTTYQKFLLQELNSPSTKTYDWWFTLDGRYVDGISHQRNMLGKNRYFIIDLEGAQKLIANGSSYLSTVGAQRVREFEINSHEIRTIISSSAKIFEAMLRITVSEKEDRKISAAYDTIDEKMIFMVTIGAPIAIISAAEAIPAVLAFGETSAVSNLGTSFKSLFSLSTKGAGTRMAYETGSEFLANGGDVGEMNVLGITTSAFGSNIAAEFVGSKYSLSINNGWEKSSWHQTALNFAIGRVNSGFGSNLDNVSELLGNSGAVNALKMTFTLAEQAGTKALGKDVFPKE